MIGPVEKKMLTDDGRSTSHKDGRQSIATVHMSDSGDLKLTNFHIFIEVPRHDTCTYFSIN